MNERVLSTSSTAAIAAQDERFPPEVAQADALEHDGARDDDEPPAGTTFDTARSGHGMLSIGKMKPDNSMVGSIVPTIAPIIATRCDEVRAEIRMPSESDTRMKSDALRPGAGARRCPQRHVEDQPRLDDHAEHADEADRPGRARPCRR